METIEEFRQRIIKTHEDRGDFVTDVDGYVYLWISDTNRGHMASHHLRWIADELDRRNEVITAQHNNLTIPENTDFDI